MYINKSTIAAYLLSIDVPANANSLVLMNSIDRIVCILTDNPNYPPVTVHKLDLLEAIKPVTSVYRFYEEAIAEDVVAERFQQIDLPQSQAQIWKVTIFSMSYPLAKKLREFLYSHKLADYSYIKNYPVFCDLEIYGINVQLLTGILVGFSIESDRFRIGSDCEN
jgi:hypothetical protein